MKRTPTPSATHTAEVLANRRQLVQREAELRRFGCDLSRGIRFVLDEALPLDGSVLEIGTGKGRFLVQLARHAGKVTTVDISSEEQKCARLNARYAGVEHKIKFVLRDAARLPWRDGTFDAAVTMNAIHHIRHFQKVLKEILRVVKPGGKIVLADFRPRGFQILDRIHRTEGRTHPREVHDFRELRRFLRDKGLTVRWRKGGHHEVIVAQLPIPPNPKAIRALRLKPQSRSVTAVSVRRSRKTGSSGGKVKRVN